MSDKELDQLFKDNFSEAEMTPPTDLWNKIEQKLEKPKARKFPIYWMAAASITLAIGSFAVFQKTDKIQLQAETAATQYPMELTEKGNQPVQDNPDKGTLFTDNSAAPSAAQHVQGAALTSPKTAQVAIDKPVESQHAAPVTENYIAQNQVVLENEKNNSMGLQPETPVHRLDYRNQDILAGQALDSQVGLTTENPQLVKTDFNLPQTAVGEDEKSIRSVGDLVNLVVEKVDKREQKILKFSTDEDEGMRLVGINLGMLKWNKKNK